MTKHNGTGLTPVGEYILLKLVETTNKSAGGILLTREKREQRGTVLGIGSKVTDIKVGQEVLFELGQFKPVEFDGNKEFALVKEEHVIGIFG